MENPAFLIAFAAPCSPKSAEQPFNGMGKDMEALCSARLRPLEQVLADGLSSVYNRKGLGLLDWTAWFVRIFELASSVFLCAFRFRCAFVKKLSQASGLRVPSS